MKKVKKIVLWFVSIVAVLYLLSCALLYFKQEKFIFHPKPLAKEFQFKFDNTRFEEHNIKTEDGTELSGLLFKVDSSKGLIFYLHGNAGALDTWGDVARNYNQLGFDVFILDYRGFGKSGGTISSEEQFYGDIRNAYNNLRQDYPENKIVILGYSIGTGPAAMLASENHPRMLILLAPYFSLTDMMRQQFSLVPTFLLNYKFPTYEFVSKTKAPVIIFHGDADTVINYDASQRLKQYLKPNDRVIILKGQGHGGINDNPEYLKSLIDVLRLGNIAV